MRIAVTGATGFLGRYIVRRLARAGHHCVCWKRDTSDTGGFDNVQGNITWQAGELADVKAASTLVDGCDAVVHAALYRTTATFRGSGEQLPLFLEKNVIGSIQLMHSAIESGVDRFIYISSCAVHEKILNDRPLDETHPLWPTSHYGAHKAAVEKFVHSFGFGQQYPICALRPTGIYGVARPIHASKWFELVQSVVRGRDVHCARGGKEVHADDVARAVELLLDAEGIQGQSYACYDRYISEWDVAHIAKSIANDSSTIDGQQTRPKNEIVNDKLRALGMQFGGEKLLAETVGELVASVTA